MDESSLDKKKKHTVHAPGLQGSILKNLQIPINFCWFLCPFLRLLYRRSILYLYYSGNSHTNRTRRYGGVLNCNCVIKRSVKDLPIIWFIQIVIVIQSLVPTCLMIYYQLSDLCPQLLYQYLKHWNISLAPEKKFHHQLNHIHRLLMVEKIDKWTFSGDIPIPFGFNILLSLSLI